MEGREPKLLLELERLRSELECDFCAFALLDGDGFALSWKLSVGNLNERYRLMSDLPGRGFHGSVVKVGRAVTLQAADLARDRRLDEYPIMIAEKLRSAYAVPLLIDNKSSGIVLAADRQKRSYRHDDQVSASIGAERIAGLLADAMP